MSHPLKRDLDHVLAHTSAVWDLFGNRRLFITGGTGFVGTWILESFAWANDRLHLNASATVLTRNSEAFRAKSPYAANHPSVELRQGSIQSFEFPSREFEFVIHAATDQVAPTPNEPAGTFEREINGTRRVLEFARRCGAKRLLFTSSGAVYGRQPSELTHIPEEYSGAPSPVESSSAYGEAKRASEFLCTAYGEQLGFDVIIARLFAFSGPYLPLGLNFAFGNFVRDALAGGPIKIAGDGTPYRSYLYAADLAFWLWNLLARGEPARPYNVGSPEAVSIVELANTIVRTEAPGVTVDIARNTDSNAPISRYVPSVERAATELGLRPVVPLEEQIRRTFEWNRKRASSP